MFVYLTIVLLKVYQLSTTDGFAHYNNVDGNDINAVYVDGLSVTCGNPRQHIWTYVAGLTDLINCQCVPNSAPFVGSNYYCEAGAGDRFSSGTYYFSNPLWDRSGCSSGNPSFSNINLPYGSNIS